MERNEKFTKITMVIIKSSLIEMLKRLLMPTEVKNFGSTADRATDMPNAGMDAVNFLGQGVMKMTLSTDQNWSKDIKPLFGTDSCQATHTGIIAQGTVYYVCDDGSEATNRAGKAYAISP